MSRGLGKVERAILAALVPAGEVTVADLRVAMPDIDKSAVSRAVRSLYRRGFIATRDKRSWQWDLRHAYVRHIALTPDGRAAMQRLSDNSTDLG
jgi:DNA-binding MarR family transcriptional regulator